MFGFVNPCPFPHSLSARRSLTTTTVVGPANRLTVLTHFEYRGRKGGPTDRPRTLAMRVKGSFISRFALLRHTKGDPIRRICFRNTIPPKASYDSHEALECLILIPRHAHCQFKAGQSARLKMHLKI